VQTSQTKQPVTVGKIFVPGGLPTVTYNPRPELRLEQQVEDYVDERHRVLSVSGPTKTGKTTLLKSIVPDATWLTGGSIHSVDEFWATVADALGLFTTSESQTSISNDTSLTTGVSGGIPSVIQGNAGGTYRSGSATGERQSRSRPIHAAAREHLRGSGLTIVVDDFHYVDNKVQEAIVRGMKDLVFDGVGFIVAAVPHRAYDVMRVEKEMTGRVQQLEIGFWSDDQLRSIAANGFSALNVLDDGLLLADRLAKESFSSPHLMQEFCLHLCKENGVRARQEQQIDLVTPEWNLFFSSRASQASKTAFDILARGPRQRTDRVRRTLKAGGTVDIYGAVLAAIAATGPKTQITYEQIRNGLREVLASDLPQRHEVTRVLDEMTKIAQKEIEGEPVVEYDQKLATLYISDPFFAFYLRWGSPAYVA
jgi:hypothetical protein